MASFTGSVFRMVASAVLCVAAITPCSAKIKNGYPWCEHSWEPVARRDYCCTYQKAVGPIPTPWGPWKKGQGAIRVADCDPCVKPEEAMLTCYEKVTSGGTAGAGAKVCEVGVSGSCTVTTTKEIGTDHSCYAVEDKIAKWYHYTKKKWQQIEIYTSWTALKRCRLCDLEIMDPSRSRDEKCGETRKLLNWDCTVRCSDPPPQPCP